MKLKTSHLIWISGFILVLSQGERVRDSIDSGNQVRRQQVEFSDRIRKNRTEARQAEKLSKTALDRVRSNCVVVVDAATGQPALFLPGERVIDPVQQNRTLRPGLAVCNLMGDTAVVSQNGTITDLARVATPDLPEFKDLMEQRR